MTIKVLLTDDSQNILVAIRRTLEEEPGITIVAEVSTYAGMMQRIVDRKPQVLVLDLHLPEQRGFTAEFVKSQLISVPYTIVVSFSNDDEAKALAESYGAWAFLDKMKLYTELIPAILGCNGGERQLRSRAATVS